MPTMGLPGLLSPRSLVRPSMKTLLATLSLVSSLISMFLVMCLDKRLEVISEERATMPNSRNKYLIIDVFGGVTNQQMMIWTGVHLARMLNRTLILPSVLARIPRSWSLPNRLAVRPFDELWDADHFVECARGQGFDVVDRGFPNGNMTVQTSRSFYIKDWGLGEDYKKSFVGIDPWGDSEHAETRMSLVVDRLSNQMSTAIRVYSPWDLITFEWHRKGLPCFTPAPHLQEMVNNYKDAMQVNFECLHARVERDWFYYCCGSWQFGTPSSVDMENPGTWTCGDNSLPPLSCYKTPEQIAKYLLDNRVEHNATLWVASGASAKMLRPLSKNFHLNFVAKNTSHFMDYGIALVEREVCSEAQHMWGVQGSTFSYFVGLKTSATFYS